jgi:hemolysin activation/secretion protein
MLLRQPLIIAALMLAFCPRPPAAAQQAARPEVDPGQVQRRIPEPVELERPPPPLAPPPASEPVTAPQGAVRFVLTAVVIDGATIFDPAALASLYEDFLARQIGLGDVEEMLRRITAKYRESGYFLSHAVAGPQTLESGILRITVIEGGVQSVSFPGISESVADQLRPYTAAVLADRPLRLVTLERAIQLINDLPGLSVAPGLHPIDEAAGNYELVLAIDRSRFSGAVSLDNRGTRSLGPAEAQAAGGVNSVLTAFDRLSLNFFTVPNQPRELLSEQLGYDLPLGFDGTRAALTVARTDLHPHGNLASLALAGDATHVGAGVTHPVMRLRDHSLWLGGAFDVLQSEQSQQGIRQFDDQLRMLRLHGLYLADDGWGGSNSLSVEASQGLDALGSSRPGASDLSRANGRPDFTKVTGMVMRQQHLLGGWYLRLSAAGQKAAEPLLVSEQFALGGTQFGRAYDPGEIAGDDGAAGSAELRYVGVVESNVIRSYEIYGFYDLGAVWNMDVSDATRRQSLASAGVGLRLALRHNLNCSLEIADPLTRTVAAESGKPVRVFASLSWGF